MDRDEKLEELRETEARIAAIPPAAFDIDVWLPGQARELTAMSDAELFAERDKALARKEKEQRQKRRDELVLDTSTQRIQHLRALRGDLRRDLEKQLTPELAAAISRMEKQIEARQEYGLESVSFSQLPGGTPMKSARGRTEADERATERARQALEKLRRLAYVQTADVPAGIAAVLTCLSAADAADLPAVKIVRRPPATAQIQDASGEYIVAEIEPDNAPGRERLLPAG